jgi:hypothetical protein
VIQLSSKESAELSALCSVKASLVTEAFNKSKSTASHFNVVLTLLILPKERSREREMYEGKAATNGLNLLCNRQQATDDVRTHVRENETKTRPTSDQTLRW